MLIGLPETLGCCDIPLIPLTALRIAALVQWRQFCFTKLATLGQNHVNQVRRYILIFRILFEVAIDIQHVLQNKLDVFNWCAVLSHLIYSMEIRQIVFGEDIAEKNLYLGALNLHH